MLDVLIQKGRIIDGTGNPWYYGDIGIIGDRISAIGKLKSILAKRIINAANCVICPGFIDMHSHSDIMLLGNARHEPKVMQGVTTDLLGLDGLSYAPLSQDNLMMMRRYLSGLNGNIDIAWNWHSVKEYLLKFDRKVAINVAYLVPHNTLRLEAMGFVDRVATGKEIKEMAKLLKKGMNEGAVGFSTGLDYCPCRYSNMKELEAICKVIADFDGLSVWHVRNKDLGLIKATEEVIRIAEKTRVKVHISHLKTIGKVTFGKSGKLLSVIDGAREKGADITFDSYPYIATSTTMVILLPRWVHEGGPDFIIGRLANSDLRRKICKEIQKESPIWDKFIITSVGNKKNKGFMGRTILESAKTINKEPAEFVCDLLLEEDLNAGIMTITGHEEDLRNIMRHHCHMAGSDGVLLGDMPNPRAWGTFPRYLGRYSRDLGILRLEEMIRHMTSAPAQRLGLKTRGIVKEGMVADLVVFDPKKIIDMATYHEPKKYPKGVEYVLVNGAICVERGKHTGVLNGRALVRDVKMSI